MLLTEKAAIVGGKCVGDYLMKKITVLLYFFFSNFLRGVRVYFVHSFFLPLLHIWRIHSVIWRVETIGRRETHSLDDTESVNLWLIFLQTFRVVKDILTIVSTKNKTEASSPMSDLPPSNIAGRNYLIKRSRRLSPSLAQWSWDWMSSVMNALWQTSKDCK